VRFAQTSIAGRALTVVVEARDRADAKGLKRVTADLEAAMRQRQATAAVYVGRMPAAFAKEIGEWTDGRGESGPFIACVDASLELAMRFIVAWFGSTTCIGRITNWTPRLFSRTSLKSERRGSRPQRQDC
jgi:hypothetical protein